MKICPQCNIAYQDDYVFCLSDGNALLDESGEQETRLVDKLVFPDRTSALSPSMLVACTSCGLANRANSKFCKKCGTVLVDEARPNVLISPVTQQAFGFNDPQGGPSPRLHPDLPPGPERTVTFHPNRFTPPQSSLQTATRNQRGNQAKFVVVGILITLVVTIAALVYSSGSGTSVNTANANASNKQSTSSFSANTRNSESARNPNNQSPEVGRTGRLTTNTNIRAASNKNAEIRGTHYEGARLEILEVDTYPTNEGYTTWYRVRLLENGCDVATNMGCGNNWERNGSFGWMEAETEGWMNAKYINLN